ALIAGEELFQVRPLRFADGKNGLTGWLTKECQSRQPRNPSRQALERRDKRAGAQLAQHRPQRTPDHHEPNQRPGQHSEDNQHTRAKHHVEWCRSENSPSYGDRLERWLEVRPQAQRENEHQPNTEPLAARRLWDHAPEVCERPAVPRQSWRLWHR